MTLSHGLAMTSIAVFAFGCSGKTTGGTGGTDAGTGGAATGGSGGATAGGSASGGASGYGAAGAPGCACPDAPPAGNDPCDCEGSLCAYVDCTSAGRTEARCASGQFTVSHAVCEMFDCDFAGQCTPNQICVARPSGAYIVACEDNACGKGPLTCDCVCGAPGCIITDSMHVQCASTCNGCP